MRRSRLPLLMLATLPAFAPQSAGAEGLDGRYPVWPSEIDRIASPLRDPGTMSEGVRLAALDELSEYASEVILPDLELALTDPSPEVRRRALLICAQRELVACVDEAEQMWEEGEGSVRLMALELLSQEPTAEHLELIYEAMRDPNDLVREQAIMLLVDAPLGDEGATAARKELVAQLGDISARVRRTAARGLGQLGPGEGALALVRLLEDIDRGVALAAATSLGQMADPRTAPALQRALANPFDPNFAAAAVKALARLPGDEIDRTLLELFDTPPRNVRRSDVARAIGGRPEPGPELIVGLVERMRDPDLRPMATDALLWLGDRAKAQLDAAAGRGLEPDLALEVGRLLEARRLQPTPRVAADARTQASEPTTSILPAADEREAWFRLLGDPEAVEVGAALAELAPQWFEGALAWQLERASTAAQVRPWLAALALAAEPILDQPEHILIWTQIAAWAHDSGASAESRCLATHALGRADKTRHAEAMREELRRLSASHLPDVRGCAAISLARHGDDPLLEMLLADPSPRVRAATALAIATIRRPSSQLRSRLAVQADRDSEMRARTSAAATLAGRVKAKDLVLLAGRRGSASGSTVISHWERFELDGEPIDVPMLGGGSGFAIVPLAGAELVEIRETATLTPIYGYGYDYHYH